MSRAYRVRVKESEVRTLSAQDAVQTQLELLELLPPEQMAELLARELEKGGFEREECGTLSRTRDGVTTTIDPQTGVVDVRAETSEEVTLENSREGLVYDDVGPRQKAVEQSLKRQVLDDLRRQADAEQTRLQEKATKELEGHLADLQKELNGAVNRATAEALKRKAAQMGEIKAMSEDETTGSLTITVEV